MKHLLFMIALLFNLSLFGQSENAASQMLAGRFEALYNNKLYDSIFALFSADMKKALPLDKTTLFFSAIREQAGLILKRTFIKYDAGFASYKTDFEKTILTVNIAADPEMKIAGLSIRPYTDESLPKMERNLTRLSLPFKEEWTVIWGGDTKALNYHVVSPAQKNAFDMLIMDDRGKSFKTDGTSNEDYYAFGKELIAPCDAEVVMMTDGIKDNIPGEMNPAHATGNTVILHTINNEFIVFAHFKEHSIKVKEGQKVKQGALLGLCGNSGNSSEPHLHFHIQNVKDMNVATGVKCYFDELVVNGEIKTDYSPIRNDKIKPE